jgi:hypothetical protein
MVSTLRAAEQRGVTGALHAQHPSSAIVVWDTVDLPKQAARRRTFTGRHWDGLVEQGYERGLGTDARRHP